MNGDRPTAAVLGRTIAKLDDSANLAAAIGDHFPGQVGHLACPQTGLGRQENDQTVAQRVSGAVGKQQEVVEMI